MTGFGIISLVAGLWVALSFPPRQDEDGDRATAALGWVLVACAVLLLGTATLDSPIQI